MANNSDILAGINELIDKVESLCGCLSVNVNMPEINVPSCGGGGDPGYKFEDPPVTQGTPPPVGYEPDPSIDSRKCKAANYVYDTIHDLLTKLNQNDVNDIATVTVGGAIALFVAFLAATPLGWAVAGVMGTAAGIIGALITAVGWNLNDILTAMNNGHTELVCALYNAQSTTQARDDFIAELQTQGINNAEAQSFMGFFLVSDALKILFQAIPGSEAALDQYVSTVDCANCSQLPDYDCILGAWYHQGANRYRVDAYHDSSTGNYFIYLGNDSIKFNVENVSLISGIVQFTTPETTEIKTGTTRNFCGEGVQDNQYQWNTNDIINVYSFVYRSHQPFTVEIDIIGI